MKLTNLELVQSILSSMSSDEVNSVGDTSESRQVLEMVRTAYYNIITRAGVIEHNQLFQLDASTDADKPVLMYRPEHISKMEWIKYFDENVLPDSNTDYIHDLNVDIAGGNTSSGNAPMWKYVSILPIQQFMDYVAAYNTDNTDVSTYVFNANGVSFNLAYKNNTTPRYCTVIQNYYVLFDAYDSEVDDTLQSSKTQCFGQGTPVWQATDSFIPNLDENQFPLLLNEAKALAFLELKQMSHPKAEQEVKRQWNTLQKNKSLTDRPTSFDKLPDYGRRSNRWR